MARGAAGWYTDPTGRHTYRYWDGSAWSNQVSDGGTSGVDPIALDPTMAAIPPAPGTKAPGFPQEQPPTVHVAQGGGAGFGAGTIVGVLIGVLIAAVIVVTLLSSLGGDDSTTTTTAPDSPVTTEDAAPATTGSG